MCTLPFCISIYIYIYIYLFIYLYLFCLFVLFVRGLRLSSSDFERLASSPSGILYRGVSQEPSVLSEKDIFLAVDLDDPSLGTDVRLIQLTVKPRACAVKAENACKIQWLIRQPSPGKRFFMLNQLMQIYPNR